MAFTAMTSIQRSTDQFEHEDQVSCPPHHWVISERHEDGYREERWECRRCGDAKCVRTPAWAGNSRRMKNTSTWTPEDAILGGEEDADLL